MSRKGNCWGNVLAESFFHTLKTELINHRRFWTREQAKQEIFDQTDAQAPRLLPWEDQRYLLTRDDFALSGL